MCTLDKLNSGESGIIREITVTGNIRRRLFELGFTKGTRVYCILTAAGNEPKAYLVRGTLIALRKEQSGNIYVSEIMR